MTERNVAVIGVGHLGERHARIYSELTEANLVAVCDVNESRSNEIAERYKCRAFSSLDQLLGSELTVEAVSIATPTSSHSEVALECMRTGVDVLVEKPITPTREQAEELVSYAKQTKRVLAVGHTERHNPVVSAVMQEVVQPRFLEIHRLGSFSPRSLDIDVVLDLMIHDLDVVCALVDRPVDSIESVGVPVLTPRVDIANARVRFEGGAVANLTASRVSQDKVRKLRVFEPNRYVSLDYMAQEATSYHLVKEQGVAVPQIVRKDLPVASEEPLGRELEDFLDACTKRRVPLVDGAAGYRALDLALQVIEAMD